MNHNAFFAALKAGALRACYLFEGTEEYIKQQALRQLCQKWLPPGLEALNLAELSDPEPDALIATAETLPLMTSKRVVVVRDASALSASRKGDGQDDALLDYLGRLPDTVCLVFYVKGKADARRRLYGWFKKHDAIVDFSPMSDAECVQWVSASLRRAGKTIDRVTAARLVFTVGRDAALLKQEMDKLCAYVQERPSITPEDIDAVCVRSTECSVFEMVDAQTDGRLNRAFAYLTDMLGGGESEFAILSMLLRQYRLLYHARRLTDEGVPASEMARLLGVAPFAAGRAQKQARRFDLRRLQNAYDYLLEWEYRLKQGQVPHEACVHNAMLRLEEILRA